MIIVKISRNLGYHCYIPYSLRHDSVKLWVYASKFKKENSKISFFFWTHQEYLNEDQ